MSTPAPARFQRGDSVFCSPRRHGQFQGVVKAVEWNGNWYEYYVTNAPLMYGLPMMIAEFEMEGMHALA